MSADQQLAVARTTRGESTHLSKAARQVVPPFLQKLYEIVNDPRNDELIRWSESGDSFYVLNHEKFAREVLGRWFKHQKFASFVRQLNMYGFHKVPHLQQGVLRSESETEPWHFEHPHFHRGQPDLLCLIQRKKQPTHGMNDGDIQMDIHEPTHVSSPPLNNLSGGQVLDIHSVVNGIAAIKRHQQAISADLNELKTSNQQLWQEALAARERHKKHQDTINRILKFLAGVFGHTAGAGQHKGNGTPGSPPRAVIPRKRQRLMIQDADKAKGPIMEEVEDDDEDDDDEYDNGGKRGSYTANNFSSVKTPDLPVRSPSLGSTNLFSPTISEVSTNYFNDQVMRPAETISRSSTVEPGTKATTPINPQSSAISPVDPSLHSLAANQAPNADQAAMWAMVQQMLSSPSSMQKLMQALASQQAYPLSNLPDPTRPPAPPQGDVSHPSLPAPPTTSQQVMMYDPNAYDFTRFHNTLPPASPSNPSGVPILPALGPPLRTGTHEDAAALEPLMHNADRLQKTYTDAADIDADVNALQLSIHSLIEDLGLDPKTIIADSRQQEVNGASLGGGTGATSTLSNGFSSSTSNNLSLHPASNNNNGASSTSTSTTPVLDAIAPDPSADFDFENFFNELSANHHRNGGGLTYGDVTSPFSAVVDPSSPIGVGVVPPPIITELPTPVGGDDASPEQLAAFLDEVSSDATGSTLSEDIAPVVHTSANVASATSVGGSGGVKGRKRKSDVADLPNLSLAPSTNMGAAEISPPKVKRKR